MTNALTYKDNFARVLSAGENRVELAYDLNSALWPWLTLPTHHPVLIEKYQYFGAMTASWEQQVFSPQTYTALTSFEWRCTDAAFLGPKPTRAVCESWSDTHAMGFTLTVGDEHGLDMYQTSGQGVAFEDRDFKLWREKSRSAALAAKAPAIPAPVAAELLGLSADGHSFIGAAFERLDQPACIALVPTRGGFHPAHPFHTGSGDHVNAAQLLDCALQAAHLFCGKGQVWQTPMQCTGGKASFQRYVELDVPFEIRLESISEDDELKLTLTFSQAGRENVSLQLSLHPTPTTYT